MKSFIAPNGEVICDSSNTILTFGITDIDKEKLLKKLPSKEYIMEDVDCITDLIAMPSCAVIISAEKVCEDDERMLAEYYGEVGEAMDEGVFWIGSKLPSFSKNKQVKYFQDFDSLLETFTYEILNFKKIKKKNDDFSRRIAGCLIVLSEIRLNPGISTKKLAEKLEVSIRTVQRYITTLQAAGEWIEYDRKAKGWFLQAGVSILFGDHLKK